MLDLNIGLDLNDDDSLEKWGVGGDESGTSNSSLLNADAAGDDVSFSVPADGLTFNFDVMEVDGRRSAKQEQDNWAVTRPELVTRELFPGTTSVYRAQGLGWVNGSIDKRSSNYSFGLTFAGQNGPARAGPQQQKPVKSRRGPKSRSSEYRGVTFYRRTGRWESHIW